MRREDSKKTMAEKLTKITGLWWLIIAIAALLIGGLFDCITFFTSNQICKIAMNITSISLITFGSVVLTTIIGTLLLRKAGLIEVIEEHISELLLTTNFIKRLNEEQLVALIKDILTYLYPHSVLSEDSSIQEKILLFVKPLINDYYFSKYTVRTNCKIKEGYIEKNIKRELYIKNANAEEVQLHVSDFFGVAFDQELDIELDRVVLNSLWVNDDDCTEKVAVKQNDITDKTGEYIEYTLEAKDPEIEQKFLLKDKEIELVIDITTRTNLDDIHFIHTPPVPCKEYKAEVIYDKNECTIHGEHFGLKNVHAGSSNEILDMYSDNWVFSEQGMAVAIDIKNVSR